MANLASTPHSDKPNSDTDPSQSDAALDYLRSELGHVAEGMIIQLEILQRHVELADYPMILHTVRQTRASWKLAYEIARRIHALSNGVEP